MSGFRVVAALGLMVLAAGCGRGAGSSAAGGATNAGAPAAVTSNQTAPAIAVADLDLPRDALGDPLQPGQMPMFRLGLWEVVETVAGASTPPARSRECRTQATLTMPEHPAACENLGFHRTPSGGLMTVADCSGEGVVMSLRSRSEGDFQSRFTTHARMRVTREGQPLVSREVTREETWVGACPTSGGLEGAR